MTIGSNLTEEEGKQVTGKADSATNHQSVDLWEQKAELEHTDRETCRCQAPRKLWEEIGTGMMLSKRLGI